MHELEYESEPTPEPTRYPADFSVHIHDNDAPKIAPSPWKHGESRAINVKTNVALFVTRLSAAALIAALQKAWEGEGDDPGIDAALAARKLEGAI